MQSFRPKVSCRVRTFSCWFACMGRMSDVRYNWFTMHFIFIINLQFMQHVCIYVFFVVVLLVINLITLRTFSLCLAFYIIMFTILWVSFWSICLRRVRAFVCSLQDVVSKIAKIFVCEWWAYANFNEFHIIFFALAMAITMNF